MNHTHPCPVRVNGYATQCGSTESTLQRVSFEHAAREHSRWLLDRIDVDLLISADAAAPNDHNGHPTQCMMIRSYPCSIRLSHLECVSASKVWRRESTSALSASNSARDGTPSDPPESIRRRPPEEAAVSMGQVLCKRGGVVARSRLSSQAGAWFVSPVVPPELGVLPKTILGALPLSSSTPAPTGGVGGGIAVLIGSKGSGSGDGEGSGS